LVLDHGLWCPQQVGAAVVMQKSTPETKDKPGHGLTANFFPGKKYFNNLSRLGAL